MNDVELLRKLESAREKILTQIRKVIVGQENVLEQILTALLAGGHCLIVGVPGLAKTMMVATLSRIFDLRFSRIQFTPDLMPADITGTEVIEENRDTGEKSFRFVPGPLFASVLLADEINRTPPKTQSALLEAMQEHRVTVGGKTYTFEEPFFVLATQNPIEQEGTYPLPEAQLDRFFFQINIGYPGPEEEKEIAEKTTTPSDIMVEKVLTREEVLELQKLVLKVPAAKTVIDYAVRLVRATRPQEERSDPFIRKYI
ncbi:MAG TPA: AAA family ATPase, partial [bacterium]|nr:AAA family ATPase [bacterium]